MFNDDEYDVYAGDYEYDDDADDDAADEYDDDYDYLSNVFYNNIILVYIN